MVDFETIKSLWEKSEPLREYWPAFAIPAAFVGLYRTYAQLKWAVASLRVQAIETALNHIGNEEIRQAVRDLRQAAQRGQIASLAATDDFATKLRKAIVAYDRYAFICAHDKRLRKEFYTFQADEISLIGDSCSEIILEIRTNEGRPCFAEEFLKLYQWGRGSSFFRWIFGKNYRRSL